TNFPTTAGAFQTTYGGTGGPFDTGDAFVTKLNPAGSALVYSTYIGGSGHDGASGVAVDANGNAYVTGFTERPDFPTTAGAFQTTFHYGSTEVFVTKLNPTGSALVYSTLLGGNNIDQSSAIAVDANGNAYVTGNTGSADFPTTPGAFQTSGGGGFITKLDPAGSTLVYSTFLNGGGGNSIAVDADGNAYVTGGTNSVNFPTTARAFQPTLRGNSDAFVTQL